MSTKDHHNAFVAFMALVDFVGLLNIRHLAKEIILNFI